VKIFLVDDEPLIRQRLKETIPWEKIGCEIVGEANNGLEAIDLIYQVNPDIIITDIRMPGLSGLELIEQLKNKLENVKFILLTGYSDFKYAQCAVKLGVFDFILKPTDELEILEVIARAKSALLKERENPLINKEFSSEVNIETNLIKYNNIVKEVINYIKKNLQQEISLKSAAESIYVNPAYLCRLIKKETGKNFIDIVNEYRIEKAKELLKNVHYKTYEVGEMVGFKYPRNFSIKFKEYTGMTPTEYKNSIHIT
jgi:two-component system, response regulator YesN